MSIGAPPVGVPPSMSTPGSLTSLMTGLVALQATLPDHPLLDGTEPLRLYRWRPANPDLPALWNWMVPSTSEMHDTASIQDTFTIVTRIGMRYRDTDERMADIEAYCDAYRALVDPSFWNAQTTPPVTAAYATWAIRTSCQLFSEEFGSFLAVGVEFTQSFWLRRHLR